LLARETRAICFWALPLISAAQTTWFNTPGNSFRDAGRYFFAPIICGLRIKEENEGSTSEAEGKIHGAVNGADIFCGTAWQREHYSSARFNGSAQIGIWRLQMSGWLSTAGS